VRFKYYQPLPRLAGLLREIVPPLRLNLRFSPEAEEAFQQERREERIDHIRFLMLYAIPLYDVFLFLDRLCIPDRFGFSLIVRLGIVTPLALLCIALVSRLGGWSLEALLAATPLPGMIGILFIYNGSANLISIGQISLILIMLYSIYAILPDFRYACCTLFAVALGDSVFLANSRALDSVQTVTLICLIWTAAILSLMACYSMERQIRISYEFQMQLRSQNTELARISNIDPLTGVHNRRYLDSELRAQWKRCLQRGQPISVLMIDLDHFKDLNDQHGHAYGDEVLILVAKTLRQALRDKQDKMARYGGEEFVVILPNRLLPSAISIAQRLCTAVRDAQLPPDSSGLPVHLTISIGVASARPTSGSGSTRMLRAADTALYKAKANGRDRVWPVAGDRDQGSEIRGRKTEPHK
jgi:diguanylate cyclase (GGDEF)-like protein